MTAGSQEGIVWKRLPNMASGGGGGPAGDPSKDYSQFGARLQREFSPHSGAEGSWESLHIGVAGSVLPVYEMPDGLLRVPTPLELQLFEAPLYLPEAPTTPTHLLPRIGRVHARIFYSIGNTGLIRVDCDWLGSVPIVAHKSLAVYAVTDRFAAGADPNYWEAAYTFSDSTDDDDPGAATVAFDTPFPEVSGSLSADPPATAYVSRAGLSSDPAAFVGTHDSLVLQMSWGVSATAVRYYVTSVVEQPGYLVVSLGGLAPGSATSMVEAIADGDPVIVRFEDVATARTRIDVAVGVLVGSRPPTALPTYTYETTAVAAAGSAAFAVPAFARKLRCSLKWGEASGSTPDAPLGQYFFAFMNRAFGALGWIDAASARESLFGEGLHVPPGTHAVQFDNRSAEAASITPSFVLGL
jgi:hypothetical protein